jgi:hypothetical protein
MCGKYVQIQIDHIQNQRYGICLVFSYAYENPITNRCSMFLSKVLVDKSALGNSSLKIPPTGYDSARDNNHRFVTYHDDQAYAAYLITYTSPIKPIL